MASWTDTIVVTRECRAPTTFSRKHLCKDFSPANAFCAPLRFKSFRAQEYHTQGPVFLNEGNSFKQDSLNTCLKTSWKGEKHGLGKKLPNKHIPPVCTSPNQAIFISSLPTNNISSYALTPLQKAPVLQCTPHLFQQS